MPIEIKELHIRVTVNAPGGGATPPPSGATTSANSPNTPGKEDLIAECVEQVLQILQDKHER